MDVFMETSLAGVKHLIVLKGIFLSPQLGSEFSPFSSVITSGVNFRPTIEGYALCPSRFFPPTVTNIIEY